MTTTEHTHRVPLSPGRLRAAVGEERKAALEVLAARSYRSLSAEIRVAIDKHLASVTNDEDAPPKEVASVA